MIIINDEYSIKSDARQWMLCKKAVNKGKEVWQPYRYFGTLESLITGFIELDIRTSDYSSVIDLSNNIEATKQLMSSILKREGLQ